EPSRTVDGGGSDRPVLTNAGGTHHTGGHMHSLRIMPVALVAALSIVGCARDSTKSTTTTETKQVGTTEQTTTTKTVDTPTGDTKTVTNKLVGTVTKYTPGKSIEVMTGDKDTHAFDLDGTNDVVSIDPRTAVGSKVQLIEEKPEDGVHRIVVTLAPAAWRPEGVRDRGAARSPDGVSIRAGCPGMRPRSSSACAGSRWRCPARPRRSRTASPRFSVAACTSPWPTTTTAAVTWPSGAARSRTCSTRSSRPRPSTSSCRRTSARRAGSACAWTAAWTGPGSRASAGRRGAGG